MHIGKDEKYIPEMKFRYRELIYRPDFYDFDKGRDEQKFP